MDLCVFCNEDLGTGKTIELREKGSIGINNASSERGDSISTRAGQVVHEECRRIYVNPIVIKSLKRKSTSPVIPISSKLLRSEKQFNFKEDCLFCGKPAHDNAKRKKHGVHSVQTTQFQSTLEQICRDRNDEWAIEVRGRIEFARDLHAADAIYHSTCSGNFRSGKNVPEVFSTCKENASSSRGRPNTSHKLFLRVTKYLEENDDEQTTIKDLVDYMKSLSEEEAYSHQHMKIKLKRHYGMSIIITELNGKENVVTFRQTATNILHNFYKESEVLKSDEENKRFLIKTAATLIKNDIRNMPVDKSFYPSVQDILSKEGHLPNSLSSFLKTVTSENVSSTKVNSIGQAIIQATRPRLVIEPLQIGLAVQLHHMFGSRFLIDTLNNMGFCSSYSEVKKFESSAVISSKQESCSLDESHCLQFVADNVDHNINTIDGNNTFHGMGIISCLSPGLKKNPLRIQRLDVTTDDLIASGHINLFYFNAEKQKKFTQLKLQELRPLKSMNFSWKIDILRNVVWPLRSPMPSWSGMMQMVLEGDTQGVSDITFLPMIDLNPSDLNCIFSTLMFVSKEASRYNRTTIITFDQPLYWKAVMMTSSEECSNIIVRLGAFHAEMSFLGSIGRIMSGSGLREILELIYAPNAVSHMLSGKAVSRAVRAMMLLDTALQCMLNEHIFGLSQFDEIESDRKEANPILVKADELYSRVCSKGISVQQALDDPIFIALEKHIQDKTNEIKQSRTSKLWLLFIEMVAILKRFLIAERTGDWQLHLSTLQEMLPYFAAAGHNLYAKSVYLYLSQMQDLDKTHPEVYNHFMKGNHVLRRTDRYWSGLSTDLIIEQVLMRSVKSTGGLTRGRGMGEAQRAQWLLSMPALAEYNQAMQTFTDTGYQTSDQHVDISRSRLEKDNKDIGVLREFLKDRDPFVLHDKTLRNIETGMIADNDANADAAKSIGDKIIQSIAGQLASEISFKKKNQVVPLDIKRTSNTNAPQFSQIDPQLMFQRLTAVGSETLNTTAELFQYELASFPSSMFESNGLLKQAAKATLGEAIWNTGDCHAEELPTTNVVNVIDGGSLLHRIPWSKGQTFSQICSKYVDHVKKRFQNPIIVMDGYNGTSTKDITHIRRSKGIQTNTITFTENMPLRVKKETFLLNELNKQRFVDLLVQELEKSNIEAIQSEGDADLLICQTAVDKADDYTVVVYGEDTDLLVLLCHYAKEDRHNIFFTSDKQMSMKNHRVWDISKTQSTLGIDGCRQLLFIHAITGCDTTSRLHGIGKPAALKKIVNDIYLKSQGVVFLQENASKEDIIKAGEEALVNLYGGAPLEGLDILRWRKFTTKTMSVKRHVVVQVQSLPPTSNAAMFHSMRVYLQCQYWKGKTVADLDPTEWGWTLKTGKLLPIQMSKQPAPDFLLKIIHCNCKTDCDNKKCSCRKNGISCSGGCGECRGINCSNSRNTPESDDDSGNET
jgi:5'-3' exonuclease